MSTFLISLVSSISAALIIYIFRNNFIFLINVLFFKSYPNIKGKYHYYSYDLKESSALMDLFNGKFPSDDKLLKFLESYDHGSNHTFISIKQFANMVFGEIYYNSKEEKKIIEKVYGKIELDKPLILQTRKKDGGDFNVYLLNLPDDSDLIRGSKISLCGNCRDTNPGYVIFKRVGADF